MFRKALPKIIFPVTEFVGDFCIDDVAARLIRKQFRWIFANRFAVGIPLTGTLKHLIFPIFVELLAPHVAIFVRCRVLGIGGSRG